MNKITRIPLDLTPLEIAEFLDAQKERVHYTVVDRRRIYRAAGDPTEPAYLGPMDISPSFWSGKIRAFLEERVTEKLKS